VILLAVRWLLRYGLSYRDVEELLAERGILVDHITIYRRVQRPTITRRHGTAMPTQCRAPPLVR
jgi:transposase-like protein